VRRHNQAFVEIGWFLFLPLTLLVPTHTHARAQNTMRCADRVRARLEAMRIRAASFKFGPRPTVLREVHYLGVQHSSWMGIHFWNQDRSNLNGNAVLWLCKLCVDARPRSRSMLVEVSGPCCAAKSDTLRPKRFPIHRGSAGERARPPVQSFFVPDQMNRTNNRWLTACPSRAVRTTQTTTKVALVVQGYV